MPIILMGNGAADVIRDGKGRVFPYQRYTRTRARVYAYMGKGVPTRPYSRKPLFFLLETPTTTNRN